MEEKNSQEVNLLDLIKMFNNWLKNVGKSILKLFNYLFKTSYKDKYSILVILIISIIIGQYYARPSNRQYYAEAMAYLFGPDAQTVKEVAKQLENVNSQNKLTSLSTKLSLPDSITKNIVSINSYYVIDHLNDNTPDKVDFKNSHPLDDTLNVRMRNRIYFRIITKNIDQIPQVQKALLNFFNSNPIISLQCEGKKMELKEKIAISEKEIQRLDSLAKMTYFKEPEKQLSWSNEKLIIGDQRKQLFYSDLLYLHDVKAECEAALLTYKQPIEFPSGLVVNPNPINGKMKYGLLSILIGLGIGILVALLNDQLKNTIKMNKIS
ncbi:MAG: hypothetical protein KBG25_05975 [Paludibacteraceae bacterium]|nr:hypothetical protein [Paludibacteraceae bacterium]